LTGNKCYNAGSNVSSRKEAYIIVNIVLAGIILLVMLYSAIFSPDSNNYPVPCIHEQITGQPCVSCGLSHSFSLIVRGRITEAYDWNNYGMRVFIFFAAQFLMRMLFSFIHMKNDGIRRQLVIFDIAASSVIFLVSFWHFFAWIFRFS